MATQWPGPDVGLTHISVVDTPRTITLIREFSFRTPTDWKFVLLKPMPISDLIEEPLVPGHECTHYFSAAWIRERCVEKGVRLDALRPQVRLGTGKVVVGRKKVRPAHPE